MIKNLENSRFFFDRPIFPETLIDRMFNFKKLMYD